ncbi:thermonuclease family protein [Rhodothalassium salexigens]|uniref:thermonuclease family protein n=1 Tax=Rhodothalassium salexigens TaxID=1086 RepID=UPI0019121EA6
MPERWQRAKEAGAGRLPRADSQPVGDRGPPVAIVCALSIALVASAPVAPASAPSTLAQAAPPAALAALTEGAGMRVASVSDGLSLRDDAGETLRLADLWAPRRTVQGEAAPAADRARAVLARLAQGRRFVRYAAEPAQDRYAIPQVHLVRDDGLWLQRALLQAGAAQVDPWTDREAVRAALFEAEAVARQAGRGLWRTPSMGRRHADSLDARDRDRFRIVVGRVESVGRGDLGVFINFGRDWSRDLTLLVPTGHVRAMGGMAGLRALEGRTVEARGVLDWWRGPFLRVRRPGTLRPLAPADDAE